MFRNKKKKPGNSFLDSDFMHYLRFAAVPVAAVLLILVIVRSDRGGGQEEAGAAGGMEAGVSAEAGAAGETETGVSAEAGAAGETETEFSAEGAGTDPADGAGTEGEEIAVPSGADPAGGPGDGAAAQTEPDSYADIDISQYTLRQDEVPELTELVRTYCQAREDQDVELLAGLFGISGLTETEAEEERKKLELVHASVRSYENISCYSIEGPQPDSYVIFPYFELNYREAETDMPQLTWAYAVKREDGSYIMTREVSQAVADYIRRIGNRDDVRALRAQVEEARAEAVEADGTGTLRSIYGGEGSEVVIS